METNSDLKYMLAYLWILSIIGAFMYGHEFGLVNKVDRGVANSKLAECQAFVMGEK